MATCTDDRSVIIGRRPAQAVGGTHSLTDGARRAEAVAERRRELTDAARRQAGGHRAELRTALGLARLRCDDDLARDLDDVRRRMSALVAGTPRARVREILTAELDDLARRSAERVDATAGPAVRRVAARLCPGAPLLPLPGPEPAAADVTGPCGHRPHPGGVPCRLTARCDAGSCGVPAARTGGSGERRPDPRRPATSRWSRVVADPRLLAAAAGVPVLGAGGFGGPGALTATGVLLLIGAAAGHRAAVTGRDRLHDEVARAVTAAGASAERHLRRRLAGIEIAAGAALDRAVARRRARADAELAALEVPGAVR